MASSKGPQKNDAPPPKKTSQQDRNDDFLTLLKKDSESLFPTIRKIGSGMDPTMWPIDCQVLDKQVNHIYYAPREPEPYCEQIEKSVHPKPFGKRRGKVVYEYLMKNSHCFLKSCAYGNCDCIQHFEAKEDFLQFESRFESGNLAKAVRISPEYYELYLRNDLYTFKQRQWFYFKVSNMNKHVTYRFSIVNMSKNEKLYNEGMKPLMYSNLEALYHHIGWKRCGKNVKYFCNEVSEDIDNSHTYTLTFTIQFPFDNDEVYFAYSYPYTYTDLRKYLSQLTKNVAASSHTSVKLLCKTLAGNNVYCVTVNNNINKTRKKAIVITARIRPGETPSSWMMKGFIDFLIGDSDIAKRLRDLFVFQLVPMINPDGVIVGNTCCSLSGKDLNGEYKTTYLNRFPTIWYTKLMIERMNNQYGVVMFCDLRAQNVMHNIFLFGCDSTRGLGKRTGVRTLPTMLYRNASDKFSLASCKYNNETFSGSTARVVMWLMGIPNSFTIEASFGGSSLGSRLGTHFNVTDYEQMAHTFCATLLDFYQVDSIQVISDKVLSKVKKTVSHEKAIKGIVKPVENGRPHTEGSDRYLSKENSIEFNNIPFSEFLTLSTNSVFPIVRMHHSALEKLHWPAECQVAQSHIAHIHFAPPEPEPYYVPTGKEPKPVPAGQRKGKIVYQYQINALQNFNGCDKNCQFALPIVDKSEGSLQFESRFESGNLAKAIKINDVCYELYVRNDLYSTSQKQWFYFRVCNMKSRLTYRFSIVNMSKQEKLYGQGMKPLLYSTKDATSKKIGWRRWGENINYFCNEGMNIEEGVTYTLTFTLEFPHENDTVYLAYCYPYTYTDLRNYLCELCNNRIKSKYTTVRQLCKTLAGNDLYYVTITAPRGRRSSSNKPVIVVTARIHPAETPSSWMMKGFLDFLTSESAIAKRLREKFIFKLVPMLNPDGVIVGNTRYSLAGKDLNGQFKYGDKRTYPTVWYTKLLIRRTVEKRGVALYCDLHAQYSIHNIFIYGCDKHRGQNRYSEVQAFPIKLSKNASDKFALDSCKYNGERVKEGTGRMEVWMMGIPNCYTVEASFAGSTLDNRAGTHFNVHDYEQLGHSFCKTIFEYFSDRSDQSIISQGNFILPFFALVVQKNSVETEQTTINNRGKVDSQTSEDKEQQDEDYIRLLAKDSDEIFPKIRNITSIPQPRWPSECEVIEDKIQHMYYVPPIPEPFYVPTKRDLRLRPYDSRRRKVIFQNPTSTLKCFYNASFNGKTFETNPVENQEDSLCFESRFECGNLAKVIKVSDAQYELHLRSDLYTNRQKQWFYFRITNMKANNVYRFSIVNMSKEENLYREGMKPLMYSKKFAVWNGIGWRRCGEEINFSQKGDRSMNYTLTFSLQFPYDNDTVYLAYSYPYTYTDLQNYLFGLSKDPIKSGFTTLRLLCHTLAGNNVYYVNITSPPSRIVAKTKSETGKTVNARRCKSDKLKRKSDHVIKHEKKTVIITARMHADETPSSWMMKGFLDFLTGSTKTAQQLRERFVFKLVPMLNPDGVVVGNTNFSLTGRDLDEQFKNPDRKKFPSVWCVKAMVERAIKRTGVLLFCDLHAQYAHHNMFTRSCHFKKGLKISEVQSFSFMLYQNASDKFAFESCKFTTNNIVKTCGYTVMAGLGITNSITLEASFGGSLLGNRSKTHFSVGDYEKIAHSFCQALLNYHENNLRAERMAMHIESLIPSKESLQEKYFGRQFQKINVEKENLMNYQQLVQKSSKEIFPVVRNVIKLADIPRWPAWCQVVNEKIKHIYYVPNNTEPYYETTGKEARPRPFGIKRGKTVYFCPCTNVTSTTNSKGNGESDTCIYDREALVFESKFESGNLARAVKLYDTYYELYVRNDLYTSKQRQWYYFRVTNMKKGLIYRFSIVNLTRDEHLYKQGMKPLMYSKIDADKYKIGWRRYGEEIAYYHNDGILSRDLLNTYTLTFTFQFPHENDQVYFAYCYPYTYSDLQDYLVDLATNPKTSANVTLRTLCKTLSGNNLYYVVVTAPTRKVLRSSVDREKPKEIRKPKKAIILTARIHPAETPSSWMMKGILDFLTSNVITARELREQFVFKLVPMLNPDGVIVGNTRFSLVGTDLNREYKYGLPNKFPTVWFTKLMTQKTMDDCGVAMYCDLHSQFALNNIFIYGCDSKSGAEKPFEAQEFPLLLHKKASDKFCFESCRFSNGRFKEGTARITMWSMGISHSFTVEASFGGSSLGNRARTHFTVQDFEQMGHCLCGTILEYFKDPHKPNKKNC